MCEAEVGEIHKFRVVLLNFIQENNYNQYPYFMILSTEYFISKSVEYTTILKEILFHLIKIL